MAAPGKESSLLTNALAALVRISGKQWRRREERHPHPMRDFLEERGWLVSEERITKRSEEDELCVSIPGDGRNEVILLPPVEGQPRLAALLAVKWCFGGEVSRGSFRIFFVERSNQDGIEEPVSPFVIRYDDMEGHVGWRFGHAQLTDRTTPYDSWMEPVDIGKGRLPSRVPRIPLASLQRNASSVLMCLIASIYGTESRVFGSVGRCVSASSEANDVMKKLAHSQTERDSNI